MSDDAPKKEEDGGVPAWVMTFADLMTLLMCFFVLMLAFSEMDAAKFKQLAGSVREAFGVQSEIEANTIPKGTSIIAQEFSPGKPEPTAMNEVRQFTTDTNKQTLEFVDPDLVERDKIQRRLQAEEDARRLREALKKEIDEGRVAVRGDESRVIIHVLEKGTFPSGYADIEPSFVPVLEKISLLIADMAGTIRVAGHTDDVPISNARFRSNWDLSSARAVSVTHILLRNDALDAGRVVITGHGETQPRLPNDSAENRAANRRVDISLIRGGRDRYAQRLDLAGDIGDADDGPAPATDATPAEETAPIAEPTEASDAEADAPPTTTDS